MPNILKKVPAINGFRNSENKNNNIKKISMLQIGIEHLSFFICTENLTPLLTCDLKVLGSKIGRIPKILTEFLAIFLSRSEKMPGKLI
jgi:hypothetical protein